jgi:hypothetical protein
VVKEERWSGGRGGSPRAPVEWSRKNTGLVIEEAVPERWSKWSRKNTSLVVEEAVPERWSSGRGKILV